MRHVSTSRMRAPNATASQHLIYTTPSHASYRWASQHRGRQPFHFFAFIAFLMRRVSTSRMRAPNATVSQHLIYTTPSRASYRWASQHRGRQPVHFFAFIAFIALAFMAFIAFFLAGAAGAAAAFMAFIALAMLAKEESCVKHKGAESEILSQNG